MVQRVKWLDVIRCFGIFLIYLGHFGQSAGYAYSFVFSHHVALFFLISGCAESIADVKNIGTTLKKIWTGILLPWLFFAAISLVCNVIETNTGTAGIYKALKQIATGTIRNSFYASSLWFLTCMAVVRFLFAFIKQIPFKTVVLAACLILFYLVQEFWQPHPLAQPSMPFNIDSALYYIVFYAIGYVAYPLIHKALAPRTLWGKVLLSLSLVISAFYAGCMFLDRNILSFLADIPFVCTFSPIIQTLLIVWTYFVAAKMCENVSIFQKIGSDTLYLCGSEYLVKTAFIRLMNIFGLSFMLSTPLSAYLYCGILLVVTTLYVVPIEKKIMCKIRQLPQYFFPPKKVPEDAK